MHLELTFFSFFIFSWTKNMIFRNFLEKWPFLGIWDWWCDLCNAMFWFQNETHNGNHVENEIWDDWTGICGISLEDDDEIHQVAHDEDEIWQGGKEDGLNDQDIFPNEDEISKVLQVENEIWPNDDVENEISLEDDDDLRFDENETTWEFHEFEVLHVEVQLGETQNGGFGGFEKFIEEERDEISKSNS